MNSSLPNKTRLVKIGEAAKILGVSIDTLRRWEKTGKIESVRTPGGTRLYPVKALKNFSKPQAQASRQISYNKPIVQPHNNLNPLARTQISTVKIPSIKELLKSIENTTTPSQKPALPVNKFLKQEPLETNVFNLSDNEVTPTNNNKTQQSVSFIQKTFLSLSGITVILSLAFFFLTYTQPDLTKKALASLSPITKKLHVQNLPNLIAQNIRNLHIPDKFVPNKQKIKDEAEIPKLVLDINNQVLAASASAGFLLINADVQIDGNLSVNEVNSLVFTPTTNGLSISSATASASLTITNNVSLDQNLAKSAAPTFSTLNLSSTTNQLVFQSGGPTGTLTWTPTAARVITLPDATTTLTGIDTAQTLSNKTISGSSNTFSSIPISALSTSKVTITAGTGLSGGGDVELGSSKTLNIDASVVTTLTGTQTLTNKTLTAPVINIGTDATGDIYYRDSAGLFQALAIGTTDQVLSVTGGIPSWETTSTVCSNCILTDPSATQTITPTAAAATGLSVAQAALGSVDIFNVTNNGGSTKYLKVDSSGNTTTGGTFTSNGAFDANGQFDLGDGGDAGTLSATTLDIDATGALQINSSGGAISIGNDSVDQNINIGTGANTTGRTITIGNSTGASALAFTSGTGSQTFTSSVVSTTGTSSAFVFNDASLTTGTLMYLQATAVTTGNLLDINTGSSIFSISNSALTTSLPTNFTSSGDVSIAYDINFTNPTTSYIKSTAPLNITAGETFNSTNLTLQTYNQGTVVIDTAATTGTSMNLLANGVTTGTGLLINANALTTGNAVSISSTSTEGGDAGSSYLLNLSRSGANSNTAHTAYGVYSTVTNTNATSGTNIAGYFSASGATTANYGLIVAAGNVGIADTSPTNALTVTGAASISSYLQIGSETATTYSRFGTGTTGHTLSGADALLVTGALEVDGAGYFDSTLDVASTLTANTFSSSGATITGGTINGTVIGGVTPAAGTFTTLVGTTINGNTITTGTGTLTLGAGKTLTASDTTTLATNSITFGGTEILTLAAAKDVTFADAFATSGAFGITLTATGTTNVTLPTTGTLSTLAGIESLSNKTLVSPVITTSPTAAGATWTDLGIVTTADINGGTIDGVTIGGSTAAAGTFTTLTATGNVQLGDNVADTLTIYPTTMAFLKENAHTIQIADSTTTDTAGGALTIKSGAGTGTGVGGTINITGGAAPFSGVLAGGTVTIQGGAGGAGSTAGASLTLNGGAGGTGGHFALAGANLGSTGNVTTSTINTGNAGTNGAGGSLSMTLGAGNNTGTGGAFTVTSGNGGAAGTAGNISFDVGTSGSSNGSILIGTAARAQTITIGNSTGGTITLGQSSGSNLALNDAQWSVTGAGAATFASVNKLTLTAPASAATLTIADGKTLTANASLTLAGTDSTTMTFPSGSGTVLTADSTATVINKTLTAPKFADLGFIADANGNKLIIFDTVTSAENELTLANAALGFNPTWTVSGTTDTNIGLTTLLKGTGTAIFGSTTALTDQIAIKPQVTDATSTFTGTITSASLGADYTWTFPAASGTVAVSATAPVTLSAAGDIGCATCLVSGSGGTFALTLAGSTGDNQTINAGDTITLAAGTDITTTGGATDTVTIANTSTLATVTGRGATTTTLVNLDGGLAVDTSNFTVSGTTGAVFTASDLEAQGNTTLGNLNTADTLTGNLLTSAITSGATTQTAFSVTGTGFTTGELLDLTGTFAPADGTTNEAIDINITHTPTVSADNFQSFNLTTTDGTALGNTIYNQQNTLTLTGNAAKTGIGVYSTVTSSSTTADTLYAGQFATAATGALSTGTRAVYGINSAPASTGASTGGTLNLYGSYLAPTSTLSNPGLTDTTANNVYGQYITTTATLAADCTTNCTTNQYGLYVANGTSSTNGTSTKYGLYVESPTGADTNYAAIFAGGNVGIGATAPSEKLVVSGNIVSGTNIITHTQLYSSYDSQSPSILEVGYGTATANSTPFPILVLSKNLTGTSNLVGAISFANSSIADGNDKRTGGIYSETSGAANSGTLQFYTSNAGTHSEKARITPAGNLGIGTTAPDAALEINHATGDSLRLTYNDSNGSATNYTDFSLSSAGALTLTGSAATLGASATAEKTYLTLTPGVITLTAPTQVTSLMETAVLTGATIAADAATTVDKATTLSLVAPIDSTNATLTASSALRVLNVTSGAGTLTNQYGLYIEALTAGTNDYGIYVADADTGSLVLASDDGDAASGITFGTTNSANLYKSAADTLKTDDNFIVGTDLTVSGGDITGANGESIDIGEASNGTISLLIDATSGLNVGSTGISSIGNVAHTIVNSSGALNIDSNSTGAINIGTGANAKTITIGNNTTSTALAFTSGTGSQTFTSSVATTGTTSSAWVFTDAALTSGTGMYLNSSSMTTGTLLGLSATAITSGKFLDISNGSSIFSISNTDVTTSLPVNFTSSGDVAIAYDINFTNPTASYIKSSAPLYIQAGPSYANNDLTLQTFGTGSVIVSQSIATTGSPTAFNVTGAAHTTLTASTEATDINFNLARTVQFAQGALTTQRAIQIQAPTYGFATGASTLTTATTLDIGAAPTAGTNATITNSSALRVGATGTSLASVAGLNYQAINIPAHTLTVTGTTQVTSSTTAALGIGQLTITDASAVTYDNASSLYISAAPTAGGSVTLTNKYALWVDAGLVRLDGDLQNGDGTTTTSKTSGFLNLNSTAGVPDGTPTPASGTVPITFDTTNNKLCRYASAAWQCISGFADYSEWAPAKDAQIAEMVTTTNNPNPINDPTAPFMLAKTSIPYDSKIIGVISKYAEEANSANGYRLSEDYHAVALVGRVPVKVSTENGPITKGDFLTSSSVPGVAMKATRPGFTIGKAMENYNQNGVSTILAFVQPAYADPGNFLASLSLDDQGNLIAPKIKTENIIIATTIDISRNDGKGLLSYASSTNTANQPTYEVDVISSLKNLEEAVINTQDKQATDSAKLADLATSTSTQSAALADLRSQVASLAGQIATSSATTPNDVADLNLTPPELLLATGSATLADLKVTSQATFSAILTAYDLSVQNTFKSLGTTTLGATNIAGDLTVDGTLSISHNSLNSLTTLYLQNSPLAQGIDIFNGLVTIDNTGKLTAQTVSAKEYLGVSGSTLGSGKIIAGTKTLTINSTLVKATSRILITPTTETSQPISVVAKTANTSFTVSMPFITTTDINFDWFIINEAD